MEVPLFAGSGTSIWKTGIWRPQAILFESSEQFGIIHTMRFEQTVTSVTFLMENKYIHIYIYTYTYTYVYMYIYIYIHTNKFMYMYNNRQAYIQISIYLSIYIHTLIQMYI